MVHLQSYSENVRVFMLDSSSLIDRITRLWDQVRMKIPNEEQFEIHGFINFITRQGAIEYWDKMNPKLGTSVDFRQNGRDGNCTYDIRENIEHTHFRITIIIDDLESKSDDYITGLIAHEISEMSYAWRSVQDEKENLKKLKSKAKQVRFNQITKQNAAIGTKDHQEHENNVDNEARRLGFGSEIEALNSPKNVERSSVFLH